jgi:hypothetical protein
MPGTAILPAHSRIPPNSVGASGSYWLLAALNRKTERERRSENVLFDVYMRLMELKGHHFWITSADIQGRESDPRVLNNFEET